VALDCTFQSVIYVVGDRHCRHIHSVFLALYGVNRTESARWLMH